jgi:hypothetical protein
MFCAPGRNRTYDRQIRRLLLYPLSYGGLGTRRPLAVRTGSHHCSAGIAGMTPSSESAYETQILTLLRRTSRIVAVSTGRILVHQRQSECCRGLDSAAAGYIAY